MSLAFSEPGALFRLAALFYCLGIIIPLLASRYSKLSSFLGYGLGIVGAVFGFASSCTVLLGPSPGTGFSLQICRFPVAGLELTGHLDSLGAFFVLLLSLLAFALSTYSIGFSKHYLGRKPVGALAALFNALLLSTLLVFAADTGFGFLFAWELMALSAFCLVNFEHEHAETRSAAILYFIMSHVGTGALLLGFVMLSGGALGSNFDDLRSLSAALPPTTRSAIFILFLIGFGTKAGMVPLHVWLPEAHPVAPSNASALLSGVLIKTGIYGLCRIVFDLLSPCESWWGVLLLVAGTTSAILGVLYALMEHDLKRLLAYHSIENIGIILMGMGAAAIFSQSGHPFLAAMALAAALFHTVNHAVFKALLFLGAGAILHATGTRNMEEMGGLIRTMPRTAACFLVGAIAISALPPLNGFVSEWLTYQALLHGFGVTGSLLRLIFPLSGAMLALTGALAAACFVKAFGITFLAQPRSEQARTAHESSPTMLMGMAFLALLCFVLGLYPSLVLRALDPVTLNATGTEISSRLVLSQGLVLGSGESLGGTVSTLGLSLAALCMVPAIGVLIWLFRGATKTRTGPTWDCGLRQLSPAMEYTATGFSKPIRMVFKALFRPKREVQRDYDYSPYFAKTLTFESHIEEAFVVRIYRPLNRGIIRLSRRMRTLQAGSIQAYLIYIFVVLLLLLSLAL